jgi:predicted permease
MAAMVTAITNGRPNPGMRFTVEPLQSTVTRASRVPWLLLLGAVVCVLGIGCVVVSVVMLARGLRRRRDVVVRLALGATRSQIVRLFAAESACLAAAGGAAALLVAWGGVHALRALAPLDTPRLDELVVQPVTVWMALAAAAFAGCAFGLLPALQGSRASADATLKATGEPGGAGRGTVRLQATLVVLQMAMAVVLLTGTAFLARSLVRLTGVDIGFDTDRLLTVRLNAAGGGEAAAPRRLQLAARAVEDAGPLPGVTAATAATGPLMAGWGLPDASRTLAQRITVEGAQVAAFRPEEANMRRVDAGYFRTLRIRVRHGRALEGSDDAGGRLVAVVNQTMARTLWADDAPLGRRFAFELDGTSPRWLEVVGIVDDTRDIAPTEAPARSFFVPIVQHPRWIDGDPLHLYVRTSGDPLAHAEAIRALIGRLDPTQPVEVSTMTAAVEQFHRAPRFRAAVLAALAGLGLLLAVLGTHAVVAHAVGQRRAEIAIRLALGASRQQVVRLIVSRTLILAGIGSTLGLGAAMVGARAARGVLFGVALNGVVFDPGTAEFWRDDPSLGWRMEAIGGPRDLGLDRNNAHVQPTGAYHYHAIPIGLLEKLGGANAKKPVLLGWAADGFPIYSPLSYADAKDPKSKLKVLKSSYRLKSGNRPSQPDAPGGTYDGAYTRDWEYVAGSGDLDECNGRFGVTPEFPDGTYYYVLTEQFPFVPRLFRGDADPSFRKQDGPPPGGGRCGGPTRRVPER